MKAVTSTVAVGLLAFGAVAGSGGSASAVPVPYVPITGCSTSVTGVTIGFLPNCTAVGGTMDHPNTSIVIGFEEAADVLGQLIDDQDGQGFSAQWVLSCDVDGATVTAPGTYTDTSAAQPPFTTIDLQSAVGSPDPNVAGTKIQGFECLSDLAQDFVQTSAGQLVNNGDCVTATKGGVLLDKCVADDTAQQWTQSAVGGLLKNTSTGTCLTAPSVKNGTPLTVTTCGGAAHQLWFLPAMTPAPVSPGAALGIATDRK